MTVHESLFVGAAASFYRMGLGRKGSPLATPQLPAWPHATHFKQPAEIVVADLR
jgi:hypothetical protein